MFHVRAFPRPEWEQKLIERADTGFRIPWREGFLAAWSWGQGPTVLLVHGWEGRGTQLGRFIDPLVDAGYRVVAFDGPGHGATSVRRASLPDQAAAVSRVVEHLGPVHTIVAHSMGAAASTLAASRGLDVARFAFIAPPVDPADFFDTFFRMMNINDRLARRVIQKTEEEYGIKVDDLRILRCAPSLAAPAFIIHDLDDREVPAYRGMDLARAWPGARLRLTNGLGHRRILKDGDVIRQVVEFTGAAAPGIAHRKTPTTPRPAAKGHRVSVALSPAG